MSEWQPGDRVRIKPALAGRFIQPWRNWIAAGRGATVLEQYGPKSVRAPLDVKIQFDCKGKVKHPDNFRHRARPEELEVLP